MQFALAHEGFCEHAALDMWQMMRALPLLHYLTTCWLSLFSSSYVVKLTKMKRMGLDLETESFKLSREALPQ